MSELGFTFYPKDWWASDSFFELTIIQRYYYLECLFLMYIENGYIKTQKTQIEKRLQTQISDVDWEIITQKFETVNGKYTHKSVNKRLRKTLANRENGKKGGRPKKNPENPINNPPLESKVNIKENKDRVPTATIEKRKEDFYNSLTEYVGEFGAKTVREFFDYWTEPNQAKTKMRFEMEKAWFTKRRLTTWKSRDTKPEEKNTFSRSDLNL